MKKLIYLIGLWLAAQGGVQAQIELAGDLNPGSAPFIIPSSFIGGQPLGDILLIVAEHPQYGRELWRMNADEEVSLLRDVFPGIEDGFLADDVVIFQGKGYFCGQDAEGVMKLYQTDGTAAGTEEILTLYEEGAENYFQSNNVILGNALLMEVEVSEGASDVWRIDESTVTLLSQSINLRFASVVGDKALVRGRDEDHGLELWVTDGTVAGTHLLKDIYSGPSNGQPSDMKSFGGAVYFQAHTENEGNELWKSDGTADGTVLLKDIDAGPGSSNPRGFYGFKEKVYFSASGPGFTEPWVTDGTPEGTLKVADVHPAVGGSPEHFFGFGDDLFFTAQGDNIGFELFKTDGTEAGTMLVKDINDPGHGFPQNHFVFNGSHFFMADDGDGLGLWTTDGTEEGTVMMKRLADQFMSTTVPITFNGKSYFSGIELYKTDGTTEGTLTISHSVEVGNDSRPQNFLNTTAGIFFGGSSDDEELGQLYILDGETITKLGEAGMSLVVDEDEGPAHDVEFINNTLYFTGYTDEDDEELWATNGTVAGTHQVKDINPDGPSLAREYFAYDGKVYFRAKDANNSNFELWASDGTEGGTVLVKDINPGAAGSSPSEFHLLDDNFIFRARTESTGTELWKSDGTTDGTVMVKDLSTGTATGVSVIFGVFLNKIFIQANDGGGAGFELWTSDGTADGFELLGDFNPGPSTGSFPENTFIELNGKVLFATEGRVWATDGTTDGTAKIENGEIGDYYFEARIGVVDGKMIFSGYDFDEEENEVHHVYYTDGTNEGSGILIADVEIDTEIIQSSDGGYVNSSYLANDELYFGLGRGIYITDGTTEGTSYVGTDKEGNKIKAKYPTVLNDHFYFTNKQSKDGTVTIYQSDGTVAGTRAVDNNGVDIRRSLHPIDNHLYFAGYTISLGEELYRFNTGKQLQSITFTAIGNQTADGEVNLTATSDSGLPVSFSVSNGPASLSGSTLSFTGAGTVNVRAEQAGNATYHPAQVEQSIEITKAEQTITFSSIENKFLEAGSFTLGATASSGLAVNYELVSGPASVSGNSVSLQEVGTVTIKASQAGNEIYLPAADVQQSFDIILVTGITERLPVVSAYPNPVVSELSVIPGGTRNQLSIRDTQGKIMTRLETFSNEAVSLNVSSWPVGIYILHVANESGVSVTKILKK